MPTPSTRRGTDRAKVGAPDRFKPPRDIAVPTLIHPCPECKVGTGENCVSLETGLPRARSSTHASRRRMARRALNQQRGL